MALIDQLGNAGFGGFMEDRFRQQQQQSNQFAQLQGGGLIRNVGLNPAPSDFLLRQPGDARERDPTFHWNYRAELQHETDAWLMDALR